MAIQNAMKIGGLKGKQIKQAIKDVVDRPEDFTTDEHFGQLAQDVIADREFVRAEPIDYRTWGSEIDKAAHGQMKQACSVPMAVGAPMLMLGTVCRLGASWPWRTPSFHMRSELTSLAA